MSQNKQKKFEHIYSTAIAFTCIAAIPAFCFLGTIINYNVPANNHVELQHQRENVYFAEENYFYTRDKIINQSYDTLKQDKEYLALMRKLDSAATYDYNQYAKLESRADSLADYLRGAYIDKNAELNAAADGMSYSREKLNNMQRDSTVRDSLLQIPMERRLSENWRQMRIDWHSASVHRHQRQLQKLQQLQK